jgi:dGTP triphosphohydrolase
VSDVKLLGKKELEKKEDIKETIKEILEEEDVKDLIREAVRSVLREEEENLRVMIEVVARDRFDSAVKAGFGTVTAQLTIVGNLMADMIGILKAIGKAGVISDEDMEKIRSTVSEARENIEELMRSLSDSERIIREIGRMKDRLEETKELIEENMKGMEEAQKQLSEWKTLVEDMEIKIKEIHRLRDEFEEKFLEDMGPTLVDKVIADLMRSGAWDRMAKKVEESVLASLAGGRK